MVLRLCWINFKPIELIIVALTGSPGLGHLHQVRQGAPLAAVRRDDEGECHSIMLFIQIHQIVALIHSFSHSP